MKRQRQNNRTQGPVSKTEQPTAAPQKSRGLAKWLQPAGTGVCVLALVAAFVVMVTAESDYLKRVEELNLFLYTPLFFKQQLVVPGGPLTYLGTYFTQYFYHPRVGSLLLCLWLGLMMWLTKRAFGVSQRWMPVLLVPVAMILLTDFDLGYWIYYLKLRGHFFVAVTGVSMAVGTTWLYRVLAEKAGGKNQGLATALLALFVVAVAFYSYPVGGFYGILALCLIGLMTWRISQLSMLQKGILSVVVLSMMAFVPNFYYRHVFYQTNSDFVFMQSLPVYSVGETFTPYYIPYIVLVVSLAALALLYRVKANMKDWMAALLPLVVAGVGVWSCWNWWYKDKTFHEEIRMNACVDKGDWEGVLKIVREHEGEPTRMIVVYKNLALFKLGRAGNEMYAYPDGAKKPDANFELRMAQLGGKNIYLHYGLPNYCYRWCLEDGVETGWRVDHLKFLLRCSLLNGEWQVAQKYIDLLKQTRYYAEWAAQYEPLTKMKEAMKSQISQHPELGPIYRLMLNTKDQLGSDQSLIEMFMLNLQAYRVTDDVVCAELALLSALQLKDIPTFWRAFNQYALLKKNGVIPRYYQEAAFLYGNLEHNVDISRMPFDPSIPANYAAFMQAAQQYPGKSEEQLKDLLRARFGDTFYYNYFLMRNMKTY